MGYGMRWALPPSSTSTFKVNAMSEQSMAPKVIEYGISHCRPSPQTNDYSTNAAVWIHHSQLNPWTFSVSAVKDCGVRRPLML
eukprot:scaffold13288_cov47-Cyclotella_meneghiniana.AAC.2